MEDSICINFTLTRLEACGLLDNARLIHEALFNKHWDEPRFSSVPITQRRDALFAAIPSMAAQQILITTLSEGIWGKPRR